jgi:hypothetical protein
MLYAPTDSFQLTKASSLSQKHSRKYLPNRNSNLPKDLGYCKAIRHHNRTKRCVNEFLMKQLKHEMTNPMVCIRITQIARFPSVSISSTACQCYIVVGSVVAALAVRTRKSTNIMLAKA